MAGIDPKNVTLSNLADGVAEELFQAAMRRVLENLDDPNTDAKPVRRITLTLTFKTDEERRSAALDVACATKLAPMKPHGTHVFIGRHAGSLMAVEALRQEEMFPEPASKPTVVRGGTN